jgi:hypothetical protein
MPAFLGFSRAEGRLNGGVCFTVNWVILDCDLGLAEG